jgi:hypothetical protein
MGIILSWIRAIPGIAALYFLAVAVFGKGGVEASNWNRAR